jgi:hypothetical protein
MRHYRALFKELVEPDADRPTTREGHGGVNVAARELDSTAERKVR